MDSIVKALQTAYADSWRDIVAGAILVDLVYFVAGAALFFFLYEKRKSKLSLKQFPAYVVEPGTAYYAAPEENVRSSSRVDRWSWLLRFFWFPPLTAIMTTLALVLGVYLHGLFNQWFGARDPFLLPEWLVAAFQVFTIFLVGDFGNYWNHRWMHRVPVYWSFHRVHHSAETLTYFTTSREHPLEVLPSVIIQGLSNGLGAGIAFWVSGTQLLSATLPALVAIGILWNIRGILYHSHIPLSFGKLDYLIGGPILHHIHHSAESHHFSTNFGVQLFVWDWMFGTLVLPKKGEQFRLGLGDDELGERNPHSTVRGLFWEPMVHAFRTLFPAKAKPRASDLPAPMTPGLARGEAE